MTTINDLKFLVRTGTTAACKHIAKTSTGPDHARYVTSDGFQFNVPISEMSTCFPIEGKAIEFLKWIRVALQALQTSELEQAELELRRG